MKKTQKKKKKEVEYFTDAMHKEIFPFQPAISPRGYGGNKPVVKPIVVKIPKK